MKLVGLMSGTSMDGIDAVLLDLDEFPAAPWEASGAQPTGEVGEPPEAMGGSAPLRIPRLAWRVPAFVTRPYVDAERDQIRRALKAGGPRDLALLHTQLAEWFSEAVLDLLEVAGETPSSIEAIGSHGQTIWHEPPRDGGRGSSLQLGCPSTLAERVGIPVISDFRARDLAAGGHGAPLVPWADAALFTHPDEPRVIQNLGGMGNVTWLPPSGEPKAILAFDTGPGVALLDASALLATEGAWTFDRDGELARNGEVVPEVLSRLLATPFFQEAPPRSTGRELFGTSMVQEARGWLEAERGAPLLPGRPQEGWPDLLATLTALTARSIGDAYRRWVFPRGVPEVFLTGGGARNPALREAIRAEIDPVPVRDGHGLGMDPDAREAAAFALLAWAHLRDLPANVPSATGASGPRVLGSRTPGLHRGRGGS